VDGIHDFGGVSGFGGVVREPHEPAFHERWEASVFTMIRAISIAGLCHNTDQFRHAVERINSKAYLEHSYYGRWLGALENLLVEAGTLTQLQISNKVSVLGGDISILLAAQPADPADVFSEKVLRESSSGASRALDTPPRYQAGDWVRTLSVEAQTHTRLPAYARDKCGKIVDLHDAWVFPDTNAHGCGEQPQYLYTVEFSGLELWGDEAESGSFTHLDLFESYLKGVNDE